MKGQEKMDREKAAYIDMDPLIGWTPGDWAIIAQEMALAAQRYDQSADRIASMQTTPNQFKNAIDGQRAMAAACREIAGRAGENAPGANF